MLFTVRDVNENHSICSSPEWADHLRDDVLTFMTAQADLGEEMLEIGPGAGAATGWLRHEVKRLVAFELDEEAAARLAERFEGTNVEVVVGDATSTGFPEESFDSVGCFTMLHHVPTAALQDAVLREALRVLRPGGVLVASDSLASDGLHHFHVCDTYNPIEAGSLVARLQALGFVRLVVVVDGIVKFIAHKPLFETGDEECRS